MLNGIIRTLHGIIRTLNGIIRTLHGIIRTFHGILRTLNGISAARTADAGLTDSPQGWRTARAVVPLLRVAPTRLGARARASVSPQRRAPDRCFCSGVFGF